MILPDSSVWTDHLRRADERLIALLAGAQIVGHALVTAEISLGSLNARERVVAGLRDLPQLRVASPEQVALLVETRRLWGRGIGYVDANLLASTLIRPGTQLWTRDRRLAEVARTLGIAADA